MISSNDILKPGKMKLQSYALPPLAAGKYVVEAELQLDNVDKGENVTYKNTSMPFFVSAPRFIIDPTLIHSVYPAENARGSFKDVVPHIVFNRKTLPWERKIAGTEIAGTARPPWMCMLMFTDKEMEALKIAEKNIPFSDLANAGNDIMCPALEAEKSESPDNVSVIDISFLALKMACPGNTELPFLAHTRQVDMTDKEKVDGNAKGWYAVLAGNRVPQQQCRNNIFLVSLEGHQKVLAGNVMSSFKDKQVRLVVLHKWSFWEEGVSFEETVEQLQQNFGIFRINRNDLPGVTGAALNAEERAAYMQVNKALEFGYCPVGHELRSGHNIASWYRGPLVPVDTPFSDRYMHSNADEALRFDEQSGMFDISYAAAWQLGRLIALKDTGFTTKVLHWKEDHIRNKPLEIAKAHLLKTQKLHPDDLEGVISEIESDEILSSYLAELWRNTQKKS